MGVRCYGSESNLTTEKICTGGGTFRSEKRFIPQRCIGLFYRLKEQELLSEGVSDLHCMSDEYLAEDLMEEYTEKRNRAVWLS